MTPEERDAVRKLLIKYESALSLAEDLALTLLEVLQPDGVAMSVEQARERRRSMGDALAMIEAGDAYAKQVWKDLTLERRAPQSAPLPPTVAKERRRQQRRPRRATN